jgi:chromosome segregation ATPase
MIATMTRHPKPTLTDAAGAAQARDRLAGLDRQLADLDVQREDVTAQLGEALAAIQLGDKKASPRAGQLSMKVAGLDGKRRDLQLTRDAVAATVGTWDAEESARRGQAAVRDLAALTGRAHTLEEHLAAATLTAAQIGQELCDVGVQWDRAYRAAAPHADVSPFRPAPRAPIYLGLRADLLEDPARTVAQWREKKP